MVVGVGGRMSEQPIIGKWSGSIYPMVPKSISNPFLSLQCPVYRLFKHSYPSPLAPTEGFEFSHLYFSETKIPGSLSQGIYILSFISNHGKKTHVLVRKG